MPAKPIPPYWREKVKELLSQSDGKASDAAIKRALKTEGQKMSEQGEKEEKAIAEGWPSLRTIGRIRVEWKDKPEEQAQYRLFSWPEAMEQGYLPWEATRCLLDLVRYLDQLYLHEQPEEGGEKAHITIRQATWYWRVCLATPYFDRLLATLEQRAATLPPDQSAKWGSRLFEFRDTAIGMRLLRALDLTKADIMGDSLLQQAVIWRLVYEPLLLDQDEKDYASSVAAGRLPDLRAVSLQRGIGHWDDPRMTPEVVEELGVLFPRESRQRAQLMRHERKNKEGQP